MEMEQDEVARARAHLTDWMQIMRNDNPLRDIVWLAGGSVEAESMVVYHLRVLQDDLLADLPTVEHRLYTNCRDVQGWQWSYVVDVKATSPQSAGHAFEHGIVATRAMIAEEWFKADMYVTNGLPPAWALYGNGLSLWNRPLPPVIAVMAKVPEGLWDYVLDKVAIRLLRYLAGEETFWMFTLDNGNEVELLQELLRKAGVSDFPRIRRVRTFSWEPEPWGDKEDIVVWSGRMSGMKRPRLGVEVFSLLPDSLRKEVFFPRLTTMSSRAVILSPTHTKAPVDQALFFQVPNTIVHAGEPPEVYRETTRKAKVFCITSVAEGYASGYWEVVTQGAIPVIADRPWNRDLLPPDWPLRFKTPGEGAEMIMDAIEHYDRYAGPLYDWCAQRFTQPINMTELVAEVWADYTVRLGDKLRLIGERGERRSL